MEPEDEVEKPRYPTLAELEAGKNCRNRHEKRIAKSIARRARRRIARAMR